ncbi:MAG: outer membrane beta-barrel protein [Saprospiraceae bacterium]|nr:outer membrane beta-barrel protein [Saprospiraceae bacterium]
MNKDFDKDFDFIDEFARDALGDFEVDFNPDDWDRMEEALDKKKHLRPRLWLLKSVELGILVLAIFTIFNFTQGNSPNANNASNLKVNDVASNKMINVGASDLNTSTTEGQASLTNATSTDDDASTLQLGKQSSGLENTVSNMLQDAPKESILREQQPTSNRFNQFLNTNDHSRTIPSFKKSNSIDNTITSSSLLGSSNFASELNASANHRNSTLADASTNNSMNLSSSDVNHSITADQNNNTSVTESDQQDKNINTEHSNHTENSNDVSMHNNATGLVPNTDLGTDKPEMSETIADRALLSTEELAALPFEDNVGDDPIFELKKQELELPFKPELRIGFMAGCEYNTASSYGRGGIGGHTGMVLDIDATEFFFISSGLSIAQKRFVNNETYTVDNTANEGLTHTVTEDRQVNMTVVNVPILAQYSVFKDNKWRISVGSGLSMNWIGVKHFSGTRFTSNQQTSGGLTMTSVLNPLDYEQGLFQGDIIQNNFYVGALAGVTIERKLGSRLSLFVVPTYQHSISRFGSTKGSLGTLSFSVGLKTSIK